MSNTKLIRGIVLIVVAALIMLYGIIGGIVTFASNLYHDKVAYPVKLRQPNAVLSTANFSTVPAVEHTLWLKVPGRQLENRDIQFIVRLIDDAGQTVGEFEEDFRKGYVRNSAGKGQYYRLGKYSFPARFSGHFQYLTKGAWRPPYEGSLILRASGENYIPIKHAVVVAVGIMVLIIGLRHLVNNNGETKAIS